ncbi:hypothetical protein Tco_0015488 [Tanacetum coccineum]
MLSQLLEWIHHDKARIQLMVDPDFLKFGGFVYQQNRGRSLKQHIPGVSGTVSTSMQNLDVSEVHSLGDRILLWTTWVFVKYLHHRFVGYFCHGYCANSIDDVGCISRARPQLAEHIKKGSVKVGDVGKVFQYQLSNEEEDYVDGVSSHIASSSGDHVPYTGVSGIKDRGKAYCGRSKCQHNFLAFYTLICHENLRVVCRVPTMAKKDAVEEAPTGTHLQHVPELQFLTPREWLRRTTHKLVSDVVTMSEYLHVPFLSGVCIVQGATVLTNHLVKDPKVVAAREKKRAQVARAAAKKKESRNKGNDKEGSSKTKKKKIPASAKGALASLNHVSSPIPLLMVALANQVILIHSGNNDGEPNVSNGDNFLASHSPHGSTNADKSSHHLNNLSTSDPVPQPREILTGQNIEEGESSRSASVYILSKGDMAQTDMLERFENLLADYDALAETRSECLETVQKLVDSRLDLEHNAKLYTDAMSHYKTVKEEHAGCEQRIKILENEKNYLSATNDDQASRI